MSEKKFSADHAQRAARWLNCNKPKMPAVAVTLISLLIVRCADDHAVTDSYITLAAKCGRGEDAVEAALHYLIEHGWVQKEYLNGKTLRLTLTDKYLEFIGEPLAERVTPDAVAFAEWFRNLQRNNITLIRYQKKIDAEKQKTAQHLNAATILRKCGGIERAKAMTMFAIADPKRKSRVLQNIHDLSKQVHSPSFIAAFEKANGTIPQEPSQQEASQPRPQQAPVGPPTTDPINAAIMRSGTLHLRQRWETLTVDQQADLTRCDDILDAAARKAMSEGKSPDSPEFPFHLSRVAPELVEKYRMEWKNKEEVAVCQN
jgi:hypothetical protein